MKTYRFVVSRYTYTIDFPIILLFFCVFLDILSTLLFVGLHIGTEKNFILNRLLSLSIWFIPLYLFSTNALFVPFLSELLRKTFSYTFCLISLLLAFNNFSLVLFNNAFLVDTLGFNTLVILIILLGIALFVYLVGTAKLNSKQTLFKVLHLALFILFTGFLHFLFLAITWL